MAFQKPAKIGTLNPYCVVECIDGLTVILKTWFISTRECYFPPYLNQSKINKMLLKKVDPDKKTWKKCEVLRIFGEYELLDIAFEKAKKVEDTSDTDIELDKSKRKSRVHKKVSESSSSESDTIDATNVEMSFLKNDQNIEASKSLNKESNKNANTGGIFETQHNGMELMIKFDTINERLDKLNKIELNIHKIKFDIQQICEYITNINMQLERNNQVTLGEIKCNISNIKATLPLKTVEDVTALEEAFKNDVSKEGEYIAYFKTIGGSEVCDAISRILVRTFTNEVATKYSWLGRRGKYAANDLQIMKIIYKSIFMSCSKVDRKSFESRTADWFRQAGARIKNIKKRTVEPTNERDDNNAESA